jgi:hypothetical protein
MKKVFISYARSDLDRVVRLKGRLELLQAEVWIDQRLRGGQEWWDEILQAIRLCDLFMPVVTRRSLASKACHLERQYAADLARPTLPVAFERAYGALPTDIAVRQIVDYAQPSEESAFQLSVAFNALEDAPPLPARLPDPPAVPLSYLSEMVDRAGTDRELTREEQHGFIDAIRAGVRSADVEESAAAVEVLNRLDARPEIYRDVAEEIRSLRGDLGPPSRAVVTYNADQPADHGQPSWAARVGSLGRSSSTWMRTEWGQRRRDASEDDLVVSDGDEAYDVAFDEARSRAWAAEQSHEPLSVVGKLTRNFRETSLEMRLSQVHQARALQRGFSFELEVDGARVARLNTRRSDETVTFSLQDAGIDRVAQVDLTYKLFGAGLQAAWEFERVVVDGVAVPITRASRPADGSE